MLARNVRVEVVRSVPKDALLVDLDIKPREVKCILDVAIRRLKAAGYHPRSIVVVPSRRHAHLVVRVTPKPKTLMEKVVLQLLCGSDPDREANNIRRAKLLKRMPRWARQTANVLYEK